MVEAHFFSYSFHTLNATYYFDVIFRRLFLLSVTAKRTLSSLRNMHVVPKNCIIIIVNILYYFLAFICVSVIRLISPKQGCGNVRFSTCPGTSKWKWYLSNENFTCPIVQIS